MEGGDVSIGGVIAAGALAARSIAFSDRSVVLMSVVCFALFLCFLIYSFVCFTCFVTCCDSGDAVADETRDVVDVQRGRAHCLRLHIGALADELRLRRNTGASELAYLLAWGLEPDVDALCVSALGLR